MADTIRQFIVLDLDRTLLDTDAFATMLVRALSGAGLDEIKQADFRSYEASRRGQTFDAISYLRKTYPQFSDTKLREHIRAAEGHFCYPGVRVLLSQLEKAAIPAAILTYGGEQYQQLKLDVFRDETGFDEQRLPACITSEANKAAWIAASWERDEAGNFIVDPRLSADRPLHASGVIIVDDKPANFRTDDPRVHGLLVDNRTPDKGIGTIFERLQGVTLERT